MTDKKLLELAAKAAGFLNSHDAVYKGGWNPLTDDGDALRLAVKLKLSIDFDEHGYVKVGSESHRFISEETVRRAIVRAAAEIGRTK